MDEKRSQSESAMEMILNSLEALIEKSHKNTVSYRDRLRNIENLTLSWEEPHPESKDPQVSDTTYVGRLTNVIEELRIITNKNSEMLEHFQRLI